MKHFTDYRIRCAKCKTIPYIDEIIYHKYGFITYHCKCGVHYISLSCFMNNLCVKSNENFDSPEEFNYCYKHKEKVHKSYCKQCKVYECCSCNNSHLSHNPDYTDDFLFSNDKVYSLIDDCDIAYNTIKENLSTKKNKIVESIEKEIEQLHRDKEEIETNYKNNTTMNNQLYKLINILGNNYSTSKTMLNFMNLSHYINFNLIYKANTVSYDSFPDIESDRAYVHPLIYRIMKFDVQLNRENIIMEKTLHQKAIEFIDKCKNTFVIHINKETKLRNLTYDYTKKLKESEGFIRLDEKVNSSQYLRNTIFSIQVDESHFAIVFLYPNELRIFNSKTYQCIMIIEYNKDEKPKGLIKRENNSIDLCTNNSITNYQFDFVNKTYEIESFVNNTTISSVLLLKDTYIIDLGNKVLTIINLKVYSLYEHEHINIIHMCKAPIDKLVIMTENKLTFWNVWTKEIIHEMTSAYSYIANSCVVDDKRIIVMNEVAFNVIDCNLYVIENVIMLPKFTNYNFKMLNVDGVIILSIENILYRMETDTYERKEIIKINEFSNVGEISSIGNRRIAIIGDNAILFYKY